MRCVWMRCTCMGNSASKGKRVWGGGVSNGWMIPGGGRDRSLGGTVRGVRTDGPGRSRFCGFGFFPSMQVDQAQARTQGPKKATLNRPMNRSIDYRKERRLCTAAGSAATHRSSAGGDERDSNSKFKRATAGPFVRGRGGAAPYNDGREINRKSQKNRAKQRHISIFILFSFLRLAYVHAHVHSLSHTATATTATPEPGFLLPSSTPAHL